MRITIVSRIYDPEPSAASFMLSAIAAALVRAGHEVTVLTSSPPRGALISDDPDIRVRRASVIRDRGGYVRGYIPYLSFDIPLAFRMLFGPRADLYVVEPPPTTGAVVRVITTLLGRPYVYDAADVWSDAARMTTSSSIVLSLLRWVEKFAMQGAKAAVTISQGVVDRVRELGVVTPTTVVGFGADTSVFHYEPTSTSDSPYFVYAGSFSEWHGAEIFIMAFAAFSERHPHYSLLFVGNGSEKERLKELAQTAGVTAIEFRDPIPGAELVPILANATASLASLKPSAGYDYAFTSKVYSSMAVGCPVVFTGPGPTIPFIAEAELSQRSGVAVAYNVSAVVGALETFAAAPLDDKGRRRLSEWASKNHSIRAAAERVVDAISATFTAGGTQ
ncbi:glycosyltransferase family 4 protein [Salinibacterium sp. PAMC 21357]|uniref:glycosyltransferase family 4 protein n=1 Tax=Salinibacterium sp. PAMC 21357 TaxID=1112215 RepID=UPI00028823BB|nr:glycosyltransferase family 4 protein [Salinibacterium sp. PAMC 21357]